MVPPCGEDAFFQSNGESPPVVSERVSGTGGSAFIIVRLSGFDASIRNDTCHRCREGDRAKNKAHKSVPCVLYNGRDNTMQWSGLRGSNSLPPPWQGGALPDELNPHFVYLKNISVPLVKAYTQRAMLFPISGTTLHQKHGDLDGIRTHDLCRDRAAF